MSAKTPATLVIHIGQLARLSSLLARRIAPNERFLLCASPAYLNKRGTP